MNNTTPPIAKLNANQFRLLNEYARTGKSEDYIMDKIGFFGVNSEDQQAVFEYLMKQNKVVKITELDEEFSGLQVCTDDDLNTLINQGYSGDWEVNTGRASECKYLRVFSLTDRSLFFIARITGFEELPNGKCKIMIADADLQRHEYKNLKFTRNVVRYINMPKKKSNRKNK